jgi:hypothetical protein
VSKRSEWPVFPIRMECPGFHDHYEVGDRYELKQFFCHESRRRDIEVTHGDLHITLNLCAHVCDNAMGYSFSEEVDELLSEYYDGVFKKQGNCELYGVKAFTRGMSWTYYWQYSLFGSCSNCGKSAQTAAETEHFGTAQRFVDDEINSERVPRKLAVPCLTDEAIDVLASLLLSLPIDANVGRQVNLDRPIFHNNIDRYCSLQCAAKATHRTCPTCNKASKETMTDRYLHYRSRICKRANVCEWNLKRNHCSRQCCSLALHDYLTKEREERLRLENLKCVQTVRKVLSKMKSALRNRDSQEVLKSLKKEFAQAANSP